MVTEAEVESQASPSEKEKVNEQKGQHRHTWTYKEGDSLCFQIRLAEMIQMLVNSFSSGAMLIRDAAKLGSEHFHKGHSTSEPHH